jgi:UDP-glucose 4-epimerase
VTSRILITGGAGFIGSHIADLLAGDKNNEIIVYDSFIRGRRENLESAMAKGSVSIIQGDIRDGALLRKAMKGVDHVFHQAAIRITQCAEEPRLALEIMADGTYEVLEAAVESKVKKVVAASSASVYGLAEVFPTNESHHPYGNRTLYGGTKLFNEALFRSFNEMYGLNYVMLRYFNVYGPRMDVHGAYTEVFIRWMQRIEAGLPPLIFGDGSQTMDFVYVEDVARANVLAAKAAVTDEVFNVASGTETSLNQLAHLLLKVMDSDLKPEYGPERKVNPVPRRLADIGKARRMLGYEPSLSLEEGLRKLIEYYRTQFPEAQTAEAKKLVAGAAQGNKAKTAEMSAARQ